MDPRDVPTVTVTELPADAVLLDVREHYEWVAGHVDGALHVPMNEVPAAAGQLPTDTPIVCICKVGGRSAHVTAWLNQNGFDARNLAGGMLAWATAHRPMSSEDGGAPRVA